MKNICFTIFRTDESIKWSLQEILDLIDLIAQIGKLLFSTSSYTVFEENNIESPEKPKLEITKLIQCHKMILSFWENNKNVLGLAYITLLAKSKSTKNEYEVLFKETVDVLTKRTTDEELKRNKDEMDNTIKSIRLMLEFYEPPSSNNEKIDESLVKILDTIKYLKEVIIFSFN